MINNIFSEEQLRRLYCKEALVSVDSILVLWSSPDFLITLWNDRHPCDKFETISHSSSDLWYSSNHPIWQSQEDDSHPESYGQAWVSSLQFFLDALLLLLWIFSLLQYCFWMIIQHISCSKKWISLLELYVTSLRCGRRKLFDRLQLA